MDKGILITGASSGIGRALALEMGRRGYRLALSARRTEALEEIRETILAENPMAEVSVRKLDVTDFDDVYAAFPEMAGAIGGIDIVVANAGVALGERIGRGDFDKAKKTIDVNLTGAIATLDAAASYFLEQKKGHLVGISTVVAWRGMPKSSVYCASKAGLAVYMEAMRAELYRKNIDVTVLYPGYIDTPLNDMLASRPFLIDVQKGAAIIARLIEKKTKSSTVPVFPWNIIGRILKVLPTRMIARM